jgi:quinoprotein relay system zinc metallohydrolase 2
MKLFQYIIILFTSLCYATSAQSSATARPDFNLNEIASGVYVHYGKHVDFVSAGHDDIANLGFIIGDSCGAVIDTGGSVTQGQSLLSAIRQKTSLPVCFVINTHIHFDHMLGNSVFRNKLVKFVGHKSLADEVIANRTFFLQQFADELGDNASEDSIAGPDILVEDNMQLDLGNRILELSAYDSAHSHTDLSIYDRQTKSLWLSDLLFIERIPALDGSLKGWLKILDTLKDNPARQLIPGHGTVILNSSSAFADQERYLMTLLSQTRKKIEEGLFMEEIVDSVGAEEKLHWLLHEQHHKRNVTKAFSELEWE